MRPLNIRPQPPLTRETAPVATALREITDRKARGRLRAAQAVAAFSELQWTHDGWAYVLDALPTVKIAEKDTERAAAVFDLTVRDETGRRIFRDRIQAWDGTPVLLPDGSEHEEDDEPGRKVRVSNFRESPVEAARLDLAHTVRVVTKNGPWVKAHPGTVSTFYSDAADGHIESGNATYATARSGGTLGTNSAIASLYIGQYKPGDYQCIEGFISFDTSALTDSDTISNAALGLYGSGNFSTTDFTIEARVQDWGATLTAADWVAGADLSAKTRVATFATSGFSTSAYNDFTEDGTNFQSNVNKTGTTYLILVSDKLVSGTAPTGDEFVGVYSADTSGTTQDPKLVVTHAAASPTSYQWRRPPTRTWTRRY